MSRTEMNCTICQQRMNAWLDHQVDDRLAAQIRDHVECCETCRKLSSELEETNRLLFAMLTADRNSSERVADRVIQQLPFQEVESTSHHHAKMGSQLSKWLGLAIAMSIGFLLATVWHLESNHPKQSKLGEQPNVPSIAELTVVSSPVQVAHAPNQSWGACSELEQLGCGSTIRTGSAQFCEMSTHNRATIRMANDTELKLADSDCITLESGRLWCSSKPDSKPLDVETPHSRVKILGTCDIQQQPDRTEILVLDGQASIRGAGNKVYEVFAPRRVSCAQDNFVEEHLEDPIVATSWIHPILSRKGGADLEFQSRVNGLLAAIGRAKVQHLYEDELRSLGENCAEPLSLFIYGCPNTSNEAPRREKAARILADIAGVGSIRSLIDLLEDPNGNVRVHVARALERLAGRNFSMPAEQWKTLPVDKQRDVADKWRKWHSMQLQKRAITDPTRQSRLKKKI